MIASLPMYDWPEVRTHTDAWWTGLAGRLRAAGIEHVPDSLGRGDDDGAFRRDPDLLFSQTCGYPFMHGEREHLQLVATPVHDIFGCSGPHYRSFVLVRDDGPDHLRDVRGGRAVINDTLSQSGYSALRAVIAPLAGGRPFFQNVKISGGHRRSMEMVGKGEADICAVDAVCYALARRYAPDLVKPLKIIADSPSTPAPPFVTARSASSETVSRLRTALAAAMSGPDLSAPREALFLAGADVLGENAYERILEIKRRAEDAGYGEVV